MGRHRRGFGIQPGRGMFRRKPAARTGGRDQSSAQHGIGDCRSVRRRRELQCDLHQRLRRPLQPWHHGCIAQWPLLTIPQRQQRFRCHDRRSRAFKCLAPTGTVLSDRAQLERRRWDRSSDTGCERHHDRTVQQQRQGRSGHRSSGRLRLSGQPVRCHEHHRSRWLWDRLAIRRLRADHGTGQHDQRSSQERWLHRNRRQRR